jgi:hypothetical protein
VQSALTTDVHRYEYAPFVAVSSDLREDVKAK